MGSVVSSIFGGGYEAPDPVEYDPLPNRTASTDPEAQAVRDGEKRKIKSRRAMGGTLLTSPLGVNGGTSGGNSGPGLLGRV